MQPTSCVWNAPHWKTQCFPVLPFLVFLEEGRENHQKNKDFYPCQTPKIPGKEGKNGQKNKEILEKKEKKQGIQKKNKERKDRVLPISISTCVGNRKKVAKRVFLGSVKKSAKIPQNQTVSNATLVDATLVFWIFCSILFSTVGAPAKKKSAFAKKKAASMPARRQSENAGPTVFGFIFRCCPPSRIFFQFFELSTKAAFAKAAFDTLQQKSENRPNRLLGQFASWGISADFLQIPKKTLWDFFAISGPEGPETPVNGGTIESNHSQAERLGKITQPTLVVLCFALFYAALIRTEKSLEIKFLGRIFQGHQGPTCRDIPDPGPENVLNKHFM